MVPLQQGEAPMKQTFIVRVAALLLASALFATTIAADSAEVQETAIRRDATVTRHRTTRVDGVDIFYREAGSKTAPVLVLLHGFPTSSRMYRNLIPALSHRYHVIAPDYPGFGQSGTPDRKQFQ